MTSNLPELRQRLANARDELRRAKDDYETVKAIAEMGVPLMGKNAEDRKRELQAALAVSRQHQQALSALRHAEHQVDAVQAAVDAAEDERRDREWAIRQRLADALSGAGHEDQAFDYLTDQRTAYQARRTIGAVSTAPASLDDLYPTR